MQAAGSPGQDVRYRERLGRALPGRLRLPFDSVQPGHRAQPGGPRVQRGGELHRWPTEHLHPGQQILRLDPVGDEHGGRPAPPPPLPAPPPPLLLSHRAIRLQPSQPRLAVQPPVSISGIRLLIFYLKRLRRSGLL